MGGCQASLSIAGDSLMYRKVSCTSRHAWGSPATEETFFTFSLLAQLKRLGAVTVVVAAAVLVAALMVAVALVVVAAVAVAVVVAWRCRGW